MVEPVYTYLLHAIVSLLLHPRDIVTTRRYTRVLAVYAAPETIGTYKLGFMARNIIKTYRASLGHNNILKEAFTCSQVHTSNLFE